MFLALICAQVTSSLSRGSYWFQDSSIEPLAQPTLVLSIFLNAYDWVERMREHPIYAPNHKEMDWLTFVHAPWTMNQTDDQYELRRMKKCQLNFNSNEVIPCNAVVNNENSHNNPVYELMMDGSGTAYKSILDLRADKIRNFLSAADWDEVFSFVPIKYENLVKANGLALVLEIIKEKTGIASETCQTSGMDLFYDVPNYERISTSNNSEYISWMNENIDWQTEELVGYHPEPIHYDEILIGTALANDKQIFNEDGTFNVEYIESRLNDKGNEISDKNEKEKYESLLMHVPEVSDKYGTKVTHKTAIDIEDAVEAEESNPLTEQKTTVPKWVPLHRRP